MFSEGLALTIRVDASKAKKEASEAKIYFCDENHFHIIVSIDNCIRNT
jgi:hypothetical protein